MRIATLNPQNHYKSIDGSSNDMRRDWKPQDVFDFRLNIVSPDIIDSSLIPKKRIKIPTIVGPTPPKPKESKGDILHIKRRKKRSLNRMVNLTKLLEVNKF